MPKEEPVARKKMRKGTHSCFECRRRKIRCIFPPDNPDVCSECFARGSRCIDQEHANPEVIVDHRKNLRERVSRLEALVDSLLEEKTEKTERSFADTVSSKTPNVYTREAFPPTPLSSEASANPLQPTQRGSSDRGHHIPILSVLEDALNDAEEQIKARMDPQRKASMPKPDAASEERYTVTNRHPEDMMDETSIAYQAKKERSKQALLGMLPPVDELARIMNSNSDWWQTWRRKCSGTSSPEQTLSQFASKAFSDGNIGAIGIVVLAVGICASDESDVDRYIEAVDRWVLSDDEYAATLEGMECLILKAKWYADVGQPRRAFISFRKGLTYAQLMGLHRKRTASAAHESIWWSLYHGDRFLSLLLGLPYGINDAHCDLSLPEFAEGNGYMPPLIFMNKMSTLAGKVIDRNQVIAEQSFAWALQLDQELEDLWKKLDPNWLEFTELLADVENNAAELRERVMGQMVFHQIRVYLHLPFMLKSASNSRFTYSRNACLNGSREMLRLYQVLRTGATQPLYECKAVDFMAFTSAVLIQLGLFNFGTSDNSSPKQVEEDVRIVEISIDIFRRASSEKGGKVALQSAEVLEKMLTKFRANGGAAGCPSKRDESCMTEFVIPYFGTISIRKGDNRVAKAPEPPISGRKMIVTTGLGGSPAASTTSRSQSQTQFTPSSDNASDFFSQSHGSNLTPVTSTSATTDQTFNFSDSGPFASYDGFYNWNNITAENPTGTNTTTSPNMAPNAAGINAKINDDSMNNFPLPTNNFSWQSMSMDIDQDWSWFLNDGQTPGIQNQPVSDQFAQQGFVGFG